MLSILKFVAGIVGIGNGCSTTQNVGGVVNLAVGTPVVLYLLAHWNDTLDFKATYGFLALVVGCFLVVLEVQRRN